MQGFNQFGWFIKQKKIFSFETVKDEFLSTLITCEKNIHVLSGYLQSVFQ
jgi:hypothetical protein